MKTVCKVSSEFDDQKVNVIFKCQKTEDNVFHIFIGWLIPFCMKLSINYLHANSMIWLTQLKKKEPWIYLVIYFVLIEHYTLQQKFLEDREKLSGDMAF